MSEVQYNYEPLPEPVPITEQEWPDGTIPLVHTRTMTYNHEPYIRECIEGILMQKTTFPVQVLIHDDASTDETADIVKEYEEKYPKLIQVYYQEKNTYQIRRKFGSFRDSRREFFSWRTGKYEALCEGDDYWIDPMKLQKQVEFMEENSNIVLCCHSVELLDTITDKLINSLKVDEVDRYLNMEELISGGGGYIGTQSIIFKKEILDNRPKFFNKSPVGDYPLVLHAKSMGNVYFLSDVMAVYRINNSNSVMGVQESKTLIQVIDKYASLSDMLISFNEYSNLRYTNVIQNKVSEIIFYRLRKWSEGASFREKKEAFKKSFKYLNLYHLVLSLIIFIPFPKTASSLKSYFNK